MWPPVASLGKVVDLGAQLLHQCAEIVAADQFTVDLDPLTVRAQVG
jgi:hypothetical protein